MIFDIEAIYAVAEFAVVIAGVELVVGDVVVEFEAEMAAQDEKF